MTATARERVLGAVRAALGRGSGKTPSEAPAPDPWTFPAETVEAPVDRFQAELEAVDGRGVDARGAGLVDALRRIADEQGADRATAGPGVPAEQIEAAGLQQVSPQEAFEAPRGVLGVVRAVQGVAETGSVLIADDGAHAPSLVVEDSVVVLSARDLVPRFDALDVPAGVARTHILVTGPSRTADIEKKLVLGAHGPIRLWVVLVE